MLSPAPSRVSGATRAHVVQVRVAIAGRAAAAASAREAEPPGTRLTKRPGERPIRAEGAGQGGGGSAVRVRFVLTWLVLLAFVVAWAFVWWLAGRANAGLQRQIGVVLVLAAVLYFALLLYSVFAPAHVT